MAIIQSLSLTESNVDVLNNTSDVRILWQSTQTEESGAAVVRVPGKYYVSINDGEEEEYSLRCALPRNRTIDILDTTFTIAHNPDGTGTVRVRTWMVPGLYEEEITQEKTLDLTTITKSSTMDELICTGAYLFPDYISYRYTSKSIKYYNRCYITLQLDEGAVEVMTIDLGQKPAAQLLDGVALDAPELKKIYNALPNSTKGTLRFTLRTYSDSGYTTQVGNSSYKEITLAIPNNATTQPRMTMTLSPVSYFEGNSEIYVKGKSKVKAEFSNVEGRYNATITSCILNVSGKDYDDTPYTSDLISTAGSVTVKGTITDSRGFSRTYTETISVIDFTAPSLNLITCDTNYLNGVINVKYTPSNDVFYTKLTIRHFMEEYSTVKEIFLGVTSATQQTATVVFSESELSEIYNRVPIDRTLAELYFSVETFLDENYIYPISNRYSAYIGLHIPDIDDTKPTAAFDVSPESSLVAPFNALYIKGKSKVKANLSNCVGKYNATITSYTVSIGGQSGVPPQTSNYFTTAGDITITGTVTDSRGFSRTYTQVITVLDHSRPRILPISGQSEVIAARCNAEGALDDNGTYLLIAARRSYSPLEFAGVQNNYCEIQYRYKVEGGEYSPWTEILSRTAANDEIITGALLDGTLSTTSTYIVQVQALDDFGESGTTTILVTTEQVYMHEAISLNSLGIGKLADEENVVDIDEELTVKIRGAVEFKSEEWKFREIGTEVIDPMVKLGRWGGSGVYYRVCAGGKHVYVAFNVSFTTSTSTVRADSEAIPDEFRPAYNVYSLCPVGFSDDSRGVAMVGVSTSGEVNIYSVHKFPGAMLSTGEMVDWVDGYIDFWI